MNILFINRAIGGISVSILLIAQKSIQSQNRAKNANSKGESIVSFFREALGGSLALEDDNGTISTLSRA